jgi:cytochrome c556
MFGSRSHYFRMVRLAGVHSPGIPRLGLIACLSLALGGAGALNAVKARQENFGVLSRNMQEVVKGLGNGVPIAEMRPSILAAQVALDRIPSLFPAGSDDDRTRALPLIWSEPALFNETYEAAARRMDELVAASQGSDRDAFGSAVGRMAAACGTCHGKFRSDRPD